MLQKYRCVPKIGFGGQKNKKIKNNRDYCGPMHSADCFSIVVYLKLASGETMKKTCDNK